MDWLPENLTVVNNRGAHADKGGEFGLMGVLIAPQPYAGDYCQPGKSALGVAVLNADRREKPP